MSFLDDLAAFLSGQNKEREPEGEVDTPEEVEEELDEFNPRNERQGLFALGWMSGDLSPDLRRRAREQYEQEHGDLTGEDWQKWRASKGYNNQGEPPPQNQPPNNQAPPSDAGGEQVA